MPGAAGSPMNVTVTQATRGPATLSISPENWAPVHYVGQTGSFSVNNTGGGSLEYTAETTDDFVHITDGATGVNSGTVRLTVDPNPGTTERTATVTVTMPGAVGSPKVFTLTQATLGPETLSISPENWAPVHYRGETGSFVVRNTGGGSLEYTAETTDDFVHITDGATGVNSGTVRLTVDPNPGTTERTATVTVTMPGAVGSPKVFTLTQATLGPETLSISPENWAPVHYLGQTGTFSVNNTGGGSLEYTAETTDDFVHITDGATGVNSGTVRLTVDPNPGTTERTATVTVTMPGAVGSPKVFTLTQAANPIPMLSVTPENRNVSADAGDTSFEVANTGGGSMTYTAAVTAGGDFLHITSGGEGGNAGTVDAHFDANTTFVQRVGTITVTAPGSNGSPKAVTVTQAARANHAPVADSQTRTTSRNTAVSVTLTATDADGDLLTFAIVAQPEHGSLTGAAPNVSYTPATDFVGTDTFTFKANDGKEDSNVATLTVTVTGAGCESAPLAPQGVSAEPDSTRIGLIHLAWAVSDTASSYRIYRRLADSQDDFVLIGTSSTVLFDDEEAPAGYDSQAPSGGCASFEDAVGCINPYCWNGCYELTHVPGTQMEYCVTAVNDCGESAPSPHVTASAYKLFQGASVAGLAPDSLIYACLCVALSWISRRSGFSRMKGHSR